MTENLREHRDHFNAREAAYHYLGFDTLDRKQLAEELNQLKRSKAPSDIQKAASMQEKFTAANDIYVSLRREVGNVVTDSHPSKLILSRICMNSDDADNIKEINYSRTYITRESLQEWFDYQGLETNKFAKVKSIVNQDLLSSDLKKIQALLNRETPCFSEDLYLCIKVWLKMSSKNQELIESTGRGLSSLHKASDDFLNEELGIAALKGEDFTKAMLTQELISIGTDKKTGEEKISKSAKAKRINAVTSWKKNKS